MTANNNLYTESKVLKVDEHQHQATCLQPDHASFQTVGVDSKPGRMEYTPQTAYMEKVEKLLVDSIIRDVKLAMKDNHTGALRTAIGKKGCRKNFLNFFILDKQIFN